MVFRYKNLKIFVCVLLDSYQNCLILQSAICIQLIQKQQQPNLQPGFSAWGGTGIPWGHLVNTSLFKILDEILHNKSSVFSRILIDGVLLAARGVGGGQRNIIMLERRTSGVRRCLPWRILIKLRSLKVNLFIMRSRTCVPCLAKGHQQLLLEFFYVYLNVYCSYLSK